MSPGASLPSGKEAHPWGPLPVPCLPLSKGPLGLITQSQPQQQENTCFREQKGHPSLRCQFCMIVGALEGRRNDSHIRCLLFAQGPGFDLSSVVWLGAWEKSLCSPSQRASREGAPQGLGFGDSVPGTVPQAYHSIIQETARGQPWVTKFEVSLEYTNLALK